MTVKAAITRKIRPPVDEDWQRRAGRGYGAAHPDLTAAQAVRFVGEHRFVTRTIAQAERVQNRLILTLGPDRGAGFLGAATRDLSAFKKQDIDLLASAGKSVRARGWITSTPEQRSRSPIRIR